MVNGCFVQPPSLVLQSLGEIEVVQHHCRIYTRILEAVYQAVIIVNSSLVDALIRASR